MSIFQGTEGNDNITGSNYNDVIYGKYVGWVKPNNIN